MKVSCAYPAALASWFAIAEPPKTRAMPNKMLAACCHLRRPALAIMPSATTAIPAIERANGPVRKSSMKSDILVIGAKSLACA